jgi:hypothetical protein
MARLAKGDRVKVEFEGYVQWPEDGTTNGLIGVLDEYGEVFWLYSTRLTKIEKVYPAGTVWVWRETGGGLDVVAAVVARSKTEFCRVYDIQPADIIVIHEPEGS